MPATPDDLSQHQCLDFPRGGLWKLRNGDLAQEVQVGGRLALGCSLDGGVGRHFR